MNEQNLIPLSKRTKEERREICSKGGKASGVARSFKSALKNKLKANPELYDDIADMLTDEALKGKNLKAVEMLIDLTGESAQREALAIKRKELRLKEKAAKSENTGTQETPQLYKALEEEK